jgi:WD40 repeat protein
VFTLTSHTDFVLAVVITPDGKQVIAASLEIIKIWDLDTEKEVLNIIGHTDSVRDMAMTKDGKLLISSSVDNTIKWWDVEQRNELVNLKLPGMVKYNNQLCLAVSHDSKYFAYSLYKLIRIFTSENGYKIFLLRTF